VYQHVTLIRLVNRTSVIMFPIRLWKSRLCSCITSIWLHRKCSKQCDVS